MTTKITKSYLTDITTSEGNLSRLSLICEIIARARLHDRAKLYKAITEEAGITNPKVIGRHLHILKTIGLIGDVHETYLVTSRGKALVKLRNQRVKVINKAEKVVFFKSFFTSIPEQLFWVIYIVGKNERALLEEIAHEYFYFSPARSIWIRTIKRAIQRGSKKDKTLTRGMRNKFETMLYWLSQLDILKKGNRVWLTKNGLKLLDAFPRNVGDAPSSVYHLAALLYYGQFIKFFDLNRQKNDLINVLREGNRSFRGEQNLSDIVAVQEFASAILVTNGIVLEEKRFYEAIQELSFDGTIKSVILGRDGKPAFLVME